MEIVVDCYNSDEQFSGWYSYLGNILQFPFEGMWKTTDGGKAEKITVAGISDFDNCQEALDMLVEIEYEGEILAEPLKEIYKIKADDEKTKEAVEDWHYWIKSGNTFEDEYTDYDKDDEYGEEDYD